MPKLIVAGFDFGTSYSKVVLREDNTQIAVVVRFNGFADGLLPSLVGYDGVNFLPPSHRNACDQIPYLKMLAAHVAMGISISDAPIRLPSSVLTRVNGNGSDIVRELLAFYFAHVVAGIRHYIANSSPWTDFDFTPGNSQDNLMFQMAVPTGLLAPDGRTEQFFRDAFILGYKLSSQVDATLTSPIPADTWSKKVRDLHPLSAEEQRTVFRWQCLIYPEVAAAVQTIFRSPNASDGRYITMDVGAGTVDINAFLRNSGQHLVAQSGNSYDRRLKYFAASVEPLGVHKLVDTYHAVNLQSTDDVLISVKQALWVLYHRALQYQPNNHGGGLGHNTWDNATFLLFGGGAAHWVYPEAFCSELNHVGIFNPQIRPLPAPDNLNFPPNTDAGRFAVAYGMSFPKYNLDKIELPHELQTFNELFPVNAENLITPPEPIHGRCRAPEGDGFCGRQVQPGEHYCRDHE